MAGVEQDGIQSGVIEDAPHPRMRTEVSSYQDFGILDVKAHQPAGAAALMPRFLGMHEQDYFRARAQGRFAGAEAGGGGAHAAQAQQAVGGGIHHCMQYTLEPYRGGIMRAGEMARNAVDFGIEGKVAVVTGASRGIGRGLALALAAHGAVVAAAARDLAELDSLVAEIRASGGRAERFFMDLREVASIRTAFALIGERLGGIDILVNNAGMGNPIPATDISETDWDWMMDLNLKGTFFCCQEAGRVMLARGRGRIVNISSQASVVAIPGEAVYCASKGGLNMLTKVLAAEWSGRGVTVNAVGPTFVRTPGTAERLDDPAFLANVLENIPRGRVASIADVAGAVIYLASDAADMVTGTLLLVDGGWTAL